METSHENLELCFCENTTSQPGSERFSLLSFSFESNIFCTEEMLESLIDFVMYPKTTEGMAAMPHYLERLDFHFTIFTALKFPQTHCHKERRQEKCVISLAFCPLLGEFIILKARLELWRTQGSQSFILANFSAEVTFA